MIHWALFVYRGVTQHSPLSPQNHSWPASNAHTGVFCWLSHSNHPSAVTLWVCKSWSFHLSGSCFALSSSRSGVKLKQPCYKTELGVVSQATEHSGHSALIQKRWPHAASERHGCICNTHKIGPYTVHYKAARSFHQEGLPGWRIQPRWKVSMPRFLLSKVILCSTTSEAHLRKDFLCISELTARIFYARTQYGVTCVQHYGVRESVAHCQIH